METLPSVIHESWYPHLFSVFQSPQMIKLKSFLSNCNFHPHHKSIFNVFSMPLNDVKIVILGQDPYPTKGHAIGYAFAVSETTNKPASLRIIEKEVGHEIDRTLKSWRNQGVFLLNTALTVESGKAGSHLSEWLGFTTHVLKILSKHVNPIWVLWGLKSQGFSPLIEAHNRNCTILKAPHPAAEVYNGGKAGFLGCNHFKLINYLLTKSHKSIINF